MTPERITREDVLRVLPLPAPDAARMLERAREVVARLAELSDRAQDKLTSATLAYVDQQPDAHVGCLDALTTSNVAIAKWWGATMVLEAIRDAAADV